MVPDHVTLIERKDGRLYLQLGEQEPWIVDETTAWRLKKALDVVLVLRECEAIKAKAAVIHSRF